MDYDIEIAKEMERQILGDKCYLDCGCMIKKICTHPNGQLVLHEEDIHLCPAHEENPRTKWLSKGYTDERGRRLMWVHKKDGEIVSDGWWFKETEHLPHTDGFVVSLEGNRMIGTRTSMAVPTRSSAPRLK